MISLAAGDARLLVDPVAGGRWASLVVLGRELIVGRDDDTPPTGWGNYPLVPFGGRIRRGKFSFRGQDVSLAADFGGHAIHGTGYLQEWTVDTSTATSVELSCRLSADWPFGGTSRQYWELSEHGLVGTLSVTAGEHAMPAQVGWHPWFVKPDSLEFHAASMYRRDDDYIAVDELVAVPPPPWDDCFASVTQPVVLRWDDVSLELRSDCDDWVVYDQPAHATCVEPMSGPPDCFNIRPLALEPGETLERRFELAWRTSAA